MELWGTCVVRALGSGDGTSWCKRLSLHVAQVQGPQQHLDYGPAAFTVQCLSINKYWMFVEFSCGFVSQLTPFYCISRWFNSRQISLLISKWTPGYLTILPLIQLLKLSAEGHLSFFNFLWMSFTHDSVRNKAQLNEFLLSAVNKSRINVIEMGVSNPTCLPISFNYVSLKLPHVIGNSYVRFTSQGENSASDDNFPPNQNQ